MANEKLTQRVENKLPRLLGFVSGFSDGVFSCLPSIGKGLSKLKQETIDFYRNLGNGMPRYKLGKFIGKTTVASSYVVIGLNLVSFAYKIYSALN